MIKTGEKQSSKTQSVSLRSEKVKGSGGELLETNYNIISFIQFTYRYKNKNNQYEMQVWIKIGEKTVIKDPIS